MNRTTSWIALAAAVCIACIGCVPQQSQTEETLLMDQADQLAHESLLIDTHQDTPWRLNKHKDRSEDLSRRSPTGHFDYERARAGGLDAVFMAVYVPPTMENEGTAGAFADECIDLVEKLIADTPQCFEFADSPEQVRSQFGDDKVSMLLGMENGGPIAGDLDNLRHFYDRGIRYITLCHSEANHICDSSYDEIRKWNGLSPFGKTLVKEMNRIGMIIDVSHVSDDSFWQVLELSEAPVVATHSSCRHFTPGWERNMSDEMIEAIAAKGGIVQITFGSIFVNGEVHKKYTQFRSSLMAEADAQGLKGKARDEFISEKWADADFGVATVKDVADHIDHAVKLIGVDNIGLGSDFDGVDNVPQGLDDVSCYPNLIAELLKRGYSEADIKKICGENFLRVWSKIREVAAGRN